MSRVGSSGSPACRPEADISLFTRLLFATYFLEAGLILVITPWLSFWDQNAFLEAYPAFQELFGSPFARGAVSGIGAITTLAGLAELVAALISRVRPDQEQSGPVA